MNITFDNIFAYFQPIFSADSESVYSFEILGRYLDSDGCVKSLGAFFNDPDTSHEDALMVDRIVRRYAMKKFAEEKRGEYLFINIRLAWLTRFAEKPEEMITLRWAEEFGISPDKLVIEITEEEFNANEDFFRTIRHYKKVGCRIALDDYGKQASDIDRLAKLKPDIIKIDMDYVHNSEKSYHYREYLRHLTAFSEAAGIEVLYEGVETQKQLDICLSLNGRYFQGFFLSRPEPLSKNTAINNTVFSAALKNSYTTLQDDISKAGELRKSLDRQIKRFLKVNPFDYRDPNLNAYLEKLIRQLPAAKLIYLCNNYGKQITCNISKNSESSGITQLKAYRYKNWSWRGYFRDTLRSLADGQKSYLSAPYHDVTTKDKVRTYSCSINDNTLLFIDLSEG